MKMQQEVFFGPIFCASLLYSARTLADETDAIKKIITALEGALGERARELDISRITSGKGRMEILEHVSKVEQLLQGQFEFVMDHPANQEIFYLPGGQPDGYYIEGLKPDDEKILNNLFLKQHLIISSSEMKALGLDDSSPQGAFEVLSKIIAIEDRIILTGKKGDVCVVAESEKLQQLKEALPLPVLISPAQAVAILYRADLMEQKNNKSISKPLEEIQQNPDKLADALEKLSIKSYVELTDSKLIKIIALPEEHGRIRKIWEECLQELDINLLLNLRIEMEQFTNRVTRSSIFQWFGHNDFVFFPETAILVRDQSSLKKIRDLRNEWVEIDMVYLTLLGLFFKNPYTKSKKISVYLKEKKIIPQNLPIDMRETRDKIIKILIPVKYKEKILNHLATLFSDHSVEVTSEIVEILNRQTGTKELKKALTILQKNERVERGLVVQKDDKNYMIFADQVDVESFKYFWVLRPVSINPLQKLAVKLKAQSKHCKENDFKSWCKFLKIATEHRSNYFNLSCRGVPTEIKMDAENLRNLNLIIASYVLIPEDVYKFISRYLRDISDYCQRVNVNDNQYFLIAKNKVEWVYRECIPTPFKSTSTENVMTYPCIVGDDKVCDLEELEEEELHFSFSQLEGSIASWKLRTGYTPMTYQVLDPVKLKLSDGQAQYLIKRRSSSITQSMSTSNRGFLSSRRSSTLFQPYIPVDLKESKREAGSYHTPGTSLFTTPPSSKGSSPVASLSSSLLPSPNSSPSSSPNNSPGHYSRSIFTSDATSDVVSSDLELYNIDLSYAP